MAAATSKVTRHVFVSDLATIERRLGELGRTESATILEQGMLLKHVRDNDMTHGQWGPWLSSRGLDPSTATRYIQVYDQFGHLATSHDLPGPSVLMELIKLPDYLDRGEFLTRAGIAKMTVKEAREAVRSEKEAAGLVKPKIRAESATPAVPMSRDETEPSKDADTPPASVWEAIDNQFSALEESEWAELLRLPFALVRRVAALTPESQKTVARIAEALSYRLLTEHFDEIVAAASSGTTADVICRRYRKQPGAQPIGGLNIDPYEILGINYGDSDAAVRRKYRALAKVVHPDTGGSDLLFKVVSAAYDKWRHES